MGEGRNALLVPTDQCYNNSVEQTLDVYDNSPVDPFRASLETATELAETDPEGARVALWKLQSDWATLERLQEILGGEPTRAALQIGAVLHLVRAELASPEPQLRELIPEILYWIGRDN